MKNLFQKAVLVALLLSSSLLSKAQSTKSSSSDGLTLSVGIETGLSTGNFNHTHKSNLGGSLQLELPVAAQWKVNANAGYINFYGRDHIFGTNVNAEGIRVIPATLGIKFFPIANLYAQANAGAAFALNKGDVGYTNTVAFLYSPQIGYQFALAKKSFIDAGIKYQGTSSFADNLSYGKINQFGLRVAYGFGL